MSADWFGLACEWYLDGELTRGDVRALSHTGFVVETTAPLEAGDELELRLVGGATRRPVYIRGIVESQVALGAENEPGVRFRLLGFSQDYGQLITGALAAEQIDNPTQQRDRVTRGEGEREWLADLLGADERPRARQEQEREDWEEYEPLVERAGVPLWSEDSLAPEAIVIDDHGELDDVVRVLAELGVKAERQSPDGDSILTSWIPPQHLLVVTAKRALKLRLPLQSLRQDFVSIAVADGDARMACSAARRLGYQYAISRPIHPLAMSMLFRQAIFAHDDRRVAPREVLCCPVRWWCGWERKRPGVILDVSPDGCLLLIKSSAARGSSIKIRVPGEVVGGRGFTLVGEVIRSGPGGGGTMLGVSFDVLSAKVQERLREILALGGPCRLTGDALLAEADGLGSKSVEAASDEPQKDRRHRVRAAMHQEVVALEHGSARVMHLLVSNDLTVDGMRVEAHPSLVLGEQLDLALYEGGESKPLILSAVVARDDGRSGWWLRFVAVTPEVHEQLTRILDRFPPVTRLDMPDPESGRVVLGQVLVHRDEHEEDELI